MQNLPSPAFVLEEEKLLNNLSLLREVQERSGVKILAALKAFSCYHVFPLLDQYLYGAAVSSVNEARLVKEFWDAPTFTYAPAFHDDSIQELLNTSSHMVFNSIGEFEKHKKYLSGHGVSPGLRINPEYSEVETSMYDPASSFSRLGARLSQLQELPDGLEGIHMHALCENDAEVLIRLFEKIEKQLAPFLHQVKWLNLGGGHMITRKGYHIDLLVSFLKKIQDKYELEVYLEPGSAVAWNTGYLNAQVLDIIPHEKLTGGIAIMDASFAAHMPDCLEMPYKPMIEGESDTGAFEYIIGGMTCLAGDQIGGFRFDTPLKVGTRLKFLDMIHYTMVKTTFFNGVEHPSICLLDSNGQLKTLKNVGYENFKSLL